mgnify:CR=1 FL=1|tara:strand:+ start:1569 stop:1862 length:294 start_codon:yes stop_codon:yes gene_type:complete
MKKIIFAVIILFGLNANAAIIKLNGKNIDRVENKSKFKKLEKICFEAPEKGKQMVSEGHILFFSYDEKIISLVQRPYRNNSTIWFNCEIQDFFSNKD